MLASWFDHQGDPFDVLEYGEMKQLDPGHGEVRVRITRSGINPGDVKKRQAWLGSAMAFPRIIPHSDGAGVIDAVGEGVTGHAVGDRVWVYGAQSYRPYGTAAQTTIVPAELSVRLPDTVTDDVGACLGIPGITAHRAVFADGPVTGQTVVVHGVLGAVSSLAAQLARRGGATVIGTVRASSEKAGVPDTTADHVIALDDDPVTATRRLAPDGIDRVIEVAFGANIDYDDAVCRNNATIAAFASPVGRPDIPFWTLLFNNITIRLLGSDDFTSDAKVQAAKDLTAAAAEQRLHIPIGNVYPLSDTAAAHAEVEAGARNGRVLVAVPQP